MRLSSLQPQTTWFKESLKKKNVKYIRVQVSPAYDENRKVVCKIWLLGTICVISRDIWKHGEEGSRYRVTVCMHRDCGARPLCSNSAILFISFPELRQTSPSLSILICKMWWYYSLHSSRTEIQTQVFHIKARPCPHSWQMGRISCASLKG